MIIEDVTGESFAVFMQREVTEPLGLRRLEWTWTRELENAAPMTYGELQEEIGYRQLGCQAVGSEICSVPDFARFVATAVSGPYGEPAGRGVLQPETVATILAPLPAGIGYGGSFSDKKKRNPSDDRGDTLLSHSGSNPGWCAHFTINTTRREGFVIASNSSRGRALNVAVRRLWLKTVLGMDAGSDPLPSEEVWATTLVNDIAFKIAVMLWIVLLAAAGWCTSQIAYGRRRWSGPHPRRSLVVVGPPVLLMLIWWYCFYAPESMPLPLPPTFLSIWTLPLLNYITALLLGWIGFSLLLLFSPPAAAKTLT